MAEPTSPVVGLDLAAVATALGLEAGPLFYALIGASIGISFASPASRTRAGVVFVCVVLSCALLGGFLGTWWFGEASIAKYARNSIAFALSWAFHPLSNAIITRLPEALDGALRKFGVKQ